MFNVINRCATSVFSHKIIEHRHVISILIDVSHIGSETYLNLWKDSQCRSGGEDLVERSENEEVEFHVNFKTNPAPTNVWLDSEGKQIPWSESDDEKSKFVAIQGNQSAILIIRDLNSEDSGFYTFYASNVHHAKQEKFGLLVKGR